MATNINPILDFSLTSSLLTYNQELIYLDVSNSRKIKFYFKDTVELRQLVDLYWSRELSVIPQDYYFAQKQLNNIINQEGCR
jgi:hypothetical protein